MRKKWTLQETDPQAVKTLSEALSIQPLLCQLLIHRNIRTFNEARSYFRPSPELLHDPSAMKDMGKAVERIVSAIRSGEHILIFGDYDVDGTTSVASLYHFISLFHPGKTHFYIPNRFREGYGLSAQGIDYGAERGVTLLICLDCGIKSVDLANTAAEKGMDIVICDHHLPGPELPKAIAILNPKQTDCAYPYVDLCACGITYKLIIELESVLSPRTQLHLRYLELVATATAADIVPMTGENRTLASLGITEANKNPSVALQALKAVSGITGDINIQNLLFMISPRVNAAGRMDEAGKVVELLTEEDPGKAALLARSLHEDNHARKEADQSITEEALALIQTDPLHADGRTTVVYQPHWHKGVVGIVASRLMDKFYRPTIVLTQSNGLISGSARSIDGFNIHDALESCSELLVQFGGHYYAAGLSLQPENLEAFRNRFEEIAWAALKPEHLIPSLRIDTEINFADLTPGFFRILRQMEPFGPGNPPPVFVVRGVRDNGYSRTLKDKHLKLSVIQGNIRMSGIGFGMADQFDLVSTGNPIDVVFHLEENEWQGKKELQLRLLDLAPSA